MAKEEDKNKKQKRPTALKRDIQNEKRRLLNRSYKSRTKTAIRNFEEKLSKKNSDEITAALQEVYSFMDKGVKKGVFKLNKASRTKSRLAVRASAV